MLFPKYLSRNKASEKGFSFIDVMGGAMIVALFFSAMFYANSRALTMLRASKETITASKILQQRMEQLRSYNWVEITDSGYLQTIMATAADAANQLTNEAETLTVSAFPPPATSGSNIQITRSTAGTVTQVSDNPDLVDGYDMVRVDMLVTWKGAPGGRTRTRATSTIIANGGLGL